MQQYDCLIIILIINILNLIYILLKKYSINTCTIAYICRIVLEYIMR